MADSDNTTPQAVVVAGKLLEAFVFAPIGAGAKLVSDGPAAVARARQELSNARFIGQLVVGQGAAQLKQRLQQPDTSSEHPPVEPVGRVAEDDLVVAATEQAPSPVEEPPSADEHIAELAIPDYDHLPAIDIVAQLESLSATELDAVEAYERANRRRRTVLGKIAQLATA